MGWIKFKRFKAFNVYICYYKNIPYRPLLKLIDRLMLVGTLTDEDIIKLLIMFDPETWDPNYEKGKINCILKLFFTVADTISYG